jgi:hypothetical protein
MAIFATLFKTDARVQASHAPQAAWLFSGLSMEQIFEEGAVGGARRDRTADLLHAMQALSQLSYGPLSQTAFRMGPMRLPLSRAFLGPLSRQK